MAGDDDRLLTAHRRAMLKGLGAGALLTGGGAVAWTQLDPLGGGGHDHGDPAAAMALVPLEDVTHTATGGEWADAGTWEEGQPTSGARVHVPEDTTVTLAHEDDARLRTVRVDGTLRTDPASVARLAVDSMVVTDAGRLELGTAAAPDVAGTTIRFIDRGPIDEEWDPDRMSRGLVCLPGAAIRMQGVERAGFLATASDPAQGDDTLELASEPTGWQVGDHLVLAGTNPEDDEDEELTVASVDGANVAIEESLQFDHSTPASDLSTYVANLTRSVVLTSENAATKRRGHAIYMGDDLQLRHARFAGLGRTDKTRPITNPQNGVPPEDADPNPEARYACHVHRAGVREDGAPARVEGCVVDTSPGWGFVNHRSHVVFEGNVAYRVVGAAFVTEVGSEIGAFRGNFALRSAGSGEFPDSRQFHEDSPGDVDDFGHGGHGFWFQGPATVVEDNVAAGHRHHGYVYWTRARPDQPVDPDDIGGTSGEIANFPLENVEGQDYLAQSDRVEDGTIPSDDVAIRRFANNTVFASGAGFDISRHRRRDDVPEDADAGEYDSVLEDFTAFAIGTFRRNGRVMTPHAGDAEGGKNGVSMRYANHLTLRNVRLLGGRGESPGIGVNHNEAPVDVRIEGGEIAGWKVGVRTIFQGDAPIRDVAFDNDVDVQLIAGGTDHRWSPQRVPIDGATFAEGGSANVFCGTDLDGDLYGLFSPETILSLDGESLYLETQAPDFVPIPTPEDVADADEDALGNLTAATPADLVGKTNRELRREYGISVEGEPVPDDAGRDPGIVGGFLEGGSGGSRREGPLIRHVTTADGTLYEVSRLSQGDHLFVYEDDEFLAIPRRYVARPYVRFETDAAGGDRPSFAYVDVTEPARLYVAYDAESGADWLGSWTRTGDTIGTSDGTRRVFSREVEPGRTVLGPASDTHRMYSLIAQRI